MKIEDFNFAGKKAIVRVDFNVPLDENGNVTDDTRIRGALPTLKKVLADGGALIMMSHMGKPGQGEREALSEPDRPQRIKSPRRRGEVRQGLRQRF